MPTEHPICKMMNQACEVAMQRYDDKGTIMLHEERGIYN